MATESQVRPLLPGTGSSLVLITSRGMLPGLELDARIDLDVLPDDQAVQFLTRVIGEARASADRVAVQKIVTWCGGLPLALRIAGQILSVHPRWPVSRLATILADEQQRLGRLSVGDRQVRTAFQVSYGQLSEAEARLFRFLGLHPGRDFDVASVASLAGIQRNAAEEILDRLVLANLVIEEDFGRFRMHDLLRLFSRETCQTADDDISRREALVRIVTYYANLAAFLNSCVVLQNHSTPAEALRHEEVSLPSPHQAITWFEVERYNLLAVLSVAVEEEWHETVVQLAEDLGEMLNLLRHLNDLLTVRQAALTAAQATEVRAVRARALGNLGSAYLELRGFQSAISYLEGALTLFQEDHERHDEAVTLGYLGTTFATMRQFYKAISCYQEALEIYEEIGGKGRAGEVLNNLGNTYLELRQFDKAIDFYGQSLTIERESGDRYGEAQTLNNLGNAHGQLRHIDEAIGYFGKSRTIYQEIGDRYREGQAIHNLGNVYLGLQQPHAAIAFYSQALAIWRESGDRHGEAQTLNNLGNAHGQLQHLDDAITSFNEALTIFREFGDRHGEAQTRNNLGNAHGQLQHLDEAIGYFNEAITIYQENGDEDAKAEVERNRSIVTQAI